MNEKMKAAVCTKYGPPEAIEIRQVPIPRPGKGEVQIKVHASSVTASDIFIRSADLPLRYQVPMRLMMGIKGPRRSIIGLVFAGVVTRLGEGISRFREGERVYGLTGFSMGAYGEYLCLSVKDSTRGCMATMPNELSFIDGTALAYGGLLALQYLKKGMIDKAKKVLVYGASGSSGTLAVQIARAYGCEVTGVCSTDNMELVKSLGAQRVYDYTAQDHLDVGDKFDLVLDAVGKKKRSALKDQCRKALNPTGRYVSIDDGSLKLDSDLLKELGLLWTKEKLKLIIDRSYSLEDIVQAHAYVEKGHKVGTVVITH